MNNNNDEALQNIYDEDTDEDTDEDKALQSIDDNEKIYKLKLKNYIKNIKEK